ncbi:hypothetical protein ACLOJK_028750 [Asimina triloba]
MEAELGEHRYLLIDLLGTLHTTRGVASIASHLLAILWCSPFLRHEGVGCGQLMTPPHSDRFQVPEKKFGIFPVTSNKQREKADPTGSNEPAEYGKIIAHHISVKEIEMARAKQDRLLWSLPAEKQQGHLLPTRATIPSRSTNTRLEATFYEINIGGP